MKTATGSLNLLLVGVLVGCTHGAIGLPTDDPDQPPVEPTPVERPPPASMHVYRLHQVQHGPSVYDYDIEIFVVRPAGTDVARMLPYERVYYREWLDEPVVSGSLVRTYPDDPAWQELLRVAGFERDDGYDIVVDWGCGDVQEVRRFDLEGHPTALLDRWGDTTWTYDEAGRKVGESLVLDGQTLWDATFLWPDGADLHTEMDIVFAEGHEQDREWEWATLDTQGRWVQRYTSATREGERELVAARQYGQVGRLGREYDPYGLYMSFHYRSGGSLARRVWHNVDGTDREWWHYDEDGFLTLHGTDTEEELFNGPWLASFSRYGEPVRTYTQQLDSDGALVHEEGIDVETGAIVLTRDIEDLGPVESVDLEALRVDLPLVTAGPLPCFVSDAP